MHSPPRRVALGCGISQLINWGISFYMPGTFAGAISTQNGWSETLIYGGLTLAMLMMAALSPFTAALLTRFGGQRIVVTGTLLLVCGCLVMAQASSESLWLSAWVLMGIGMRLSLYDAVFAALVGIYGLSARPTISQITLLGGFASVLFWPFGGSLLQLMSWHNAVLVYAACGLLSALALCVIPNKKGQRTTQNKRARIPSHERPLAILYAAFVALMTFVSNGTSTHLPQLLASYGLPVTVGMLWGLGQTGSRGLEIFSGSRLTPVTLALCVSLLIPFCFLLALCGIFSPLTLIGFVLGYGAVNGLMTIVKATLPLQLFDRQQYAERTGLLLLPAQLLAAASPYSWAWLNNHIGGQNTLWLSLSLGLLIALLAFMMNRQLRLLTNNVEPQSSYP
ncbi:MFS transporter [Enterobacteriaceae bacterium RIT691]|nr:MFS transporter [Enterobacteriaceae bacterium RIT691]